MFLKRFFFWLFTLTFATIYSTPNSSTTQMLLNFEDAEAIGLTNNVILATLKDRKEVFRMIVKEKWRN
ncbi:MAG: hypothetical protein O9301_14870, partial [Leptospira sp.]|nr:hypothetical protein [Leptospira sp.]